ncbi:MAG TPA: ribosomal protein S18-alanine N-acetyltransferase [Acidimicrobiales bacterium]|nr:ribosomal protein S18-alanine N-acetyltransferase [Acidimicrobiales bacterium]
MHRRHLPAVLRIEHRSHPRPWSLGVFNSELSQGAARYYTVARHAGRVVGYGGIMFVADEAHVTNIAVAPACRRQGIGRALLAHLAIEASARGCQSMTLEVRASNEAAKRMYELFGFVQAGVRHNYYPETHEDGLVMWLYDLASPTVQERLTRLAEPGGTTR